MAKRQTRRRKERKNIEVGVAHIQSTFNNTVITITDKSGNAIAWSSAGAMGFKGLAKALPLPPKWLQRLPQKSLWSMVCVRLNAW